MSRTDPRSKFTLNLPNVTALEAVARKLAVLARPSDTIALTGPLGAGKTTFTQHFGRALGVLQTIQSPTFTLIHRYTYPQGDLIHADVYRCDESDLALRLIELEELIIRKQHIVLIEWADKLPEWHAYWTWYIHLDYDLKNESSRQFTLSASYPKQTQIIAETLAGVDA